MSLFRKPRKPAQRRVFSAVGEEEDEAEGMEVDAPVAPPPPRIRDKPKKEKDKATKQTLLSFADEEEDGEVFRVKKSSQSKRLARAREKEKRKSCGAGLAGEGEAAGAGGAEPAARADTNSRDIPNNNKAPDKAEKKPKSLEGLILSGRAALAADGDGDLSDEPEEEPSPPRPDDGGFHRYRPESVRAALTKGQIPDAALIHAARKTRQQAREIGRADYIPVKSGGGVGIGAGAGSEVARAEPGSRLVREDGSGDEEDDERLAVRGVVVQGKPSRDPDYPNSGALDSEGEEWEEQQMQKAVSGAAQQQQAVELMGEASMYRALLTDMSEMHLFMAAPPAPCLNDAPAHLRPLTINVEGAEPRPPADAKDLIAALNERLSALRVTRETSSTQAAALRERLFTAARVRDARACRAPDLDAAYRRVQAARGYFTDLIECLDEKMPQLEALEARALAMHRRRCEFLVERRRADVRDQAQDVLSPRSGVQRAPDSEEKVRRAAEREGRRRARRLAREGAAAGLASEHRDGDSSDDELPHAEREHARQEREAVASLAAQLFVDALPAWRSVRGVCWRLARWRKTDPQAYSDAYVADCLPKLLAPYVRHEMILWNPLGDQDNEDYERMDWFKCLMMYGVRSEPLSSDSEASEEGAEGRAGGDVTERSVREDPDLMLVPTLINKVLLPKLNELVELAWDPMCVRATTSLRSLLLRSAALPPRSSAARTRLAIDARIKLLQCLAADVFLPALPPNAMEGKGGVFWRRCLGAGVRLLRAMLALCPPPAVLHADAIALKLIGTLCTAAGAAPPTASASAAVALMSSLPSAPGPLRRAALQRLAALARVVLARLQPDNPLHFKALEQARSVIAEAAESNT